MINTSNIQNQSHLNGGFMRKKINGDCTGLFSFPRIGLIIMAITTAVLATDPAGIESTKQNIISLIQTANTAQADAEVQKLIVDEPNSPAKGQALQQIAAAYKDNKQYDEAIELSRYVIANWSDEDFSMWAQMHVAWSYIIMNNNTAGQAETDKLIAEYRDKPDLPWAVCIIAELHQWFNRYKEAASLYQWVVEHYPAGTWEEKAKLGLARINVLSLIATGQRGMAWTAFDKLLVDFGGHPDMNESARAISDKFKWQEQYDDAKLVLAKVAQGTPAEVSPKVNIDVRKNEILSLIQSGKDAEAQAAIEKFTTDYSGEPNLPEALYWFARTYEWSDKYEQSAKIYSKTAMQFPSSRFAQLCWIDIAKGEFLVFLEAGENVHILRMADKLIADYPNDLYLFELSARLKEQCAADGIKEFQPGSQEYQKRAPVVWLQAVESSPSSPFASWAYHAVADYIQQSTQDYVRASECYYKAAAAWRNCIYAGNALIDAANCFELLRDSGKLSESEANLKIEAAYEKIASEYSDCPENAEALIKLGWMRFGQGRLEEAVSYFERAFQNLPVGSKPADALYVVGRYCEKNGELEKASVLYKELITTLPLGDPAVQDITDKLRMLNSINER